MTPRPTFARQFTHGLLRSLAVILTSAVVIAATVFGFGHLGMGLLTVLFAGLIGLGLPPALRAGAALATRPQLLQPLAAGQLGATGKLTPPLSLGQ